MVRRCDLLQPVNYRDEPMGYYVMLDKPALYVKISGQRRAKIHQTNRPRREHKTLEIAIAEAKRLADKVKCRALVLQVVHVEAFQETNQ